MRTAQRNSYTPPFLLASPGCFWNTFRRHGGLDTSFWRTCLAFHLLQLRLGRIVKLKIEEELIGEGFHEIKIVYLFEGLLRVSLLDGDDDRALPLLLLLPILASGHSANGIINKSESREL